MDNIASFTGFWANRGQFVFFLNYNLFQSPDVPACMLYCTYPYWFYVISRVGLYKTTIA